MKSVHVRIAGKVQGVFFRAHTKEKAESLTISGWVRNNADGTVDAVFEGDDEAIEQMLSWCRKGSPGSVVSRVAIVEHNHTDLPGGDKEFRIRF